MSENINRAAEMLRIAAKVIRDRAPDSRFYYDDADCDGLCIAEDCEIAADLLPHTPTSQP